jgi:hypothetical protein
VPSVAACVRHGALEWGQPRERIVNVCEVKMVRQNRELVMT